MSNTIDLKNCPKCRTPIPAGAPQGLCPKCVLLGAAVATEAGLPATATSEIPSLERVAAAFPQIEILQLIGRGGMGFVFKARQPHLDRFVALKLLPDKLARDPRFTERFNREGRVLARLNHPNIVSIYDFGQTEHFYFLLMEFVDGVNLRQAMQAGRFSPGEALAIVPKICEALQYAHGQGILHRDIKPENILLDTRGHVKIADFGIAKLVGDEKPDVALTATGAALGTPHYMAPEQLEKPSEVDHRADIYSLGVVFYEMLTGELPIGRFAAPSTKTPVGVNVDEVVFRTLEKDRERRYQSAGEMKTEVEHLGDAAAAAPSEVSAAQSGVGAHGTVVVAPPAPRWLKPVAVLFLILGATGLLPTLLSIGTSRFVISFFTLLAMTGVALLTRHGVWRRGALVVNAVGLLTPWLSALNVAAAMQHGTLAPDWSPRFYGMANSAGLAVLFAFLETSAFAAGLWVLLRSDVRALFATAQKATGQPATGRRGVLKWIFAGLLVSVIGCFLVSLFPARRNTLANKPLTNQVIQPPTLAATATTNASNSRASGELWSPKLASEELPIPERVLNEAHELAAKGRFEDALQRHLWYHNHALEYDQGQSAVRLSFALSYWMELARRYPKAKQALIEIRDRDTREFAGGGGYFALFMEVSAINEQLGDRDATCELFKSIQSRDRRLARECFNVTEDLLVEKGEYALCARFIPDFQERFENVRAVRERALALADRTPEAPRSLREETQRTFLKDTRQLIEILVGIERKAEAEEIRNQAVAVLNVPELQSALTDAEQKVAKHSALAPPSAR